MIITTTQSVEGKRIVDYRGIVVGEVILGSNIIKDLFASVRDVIGGRSGTYEKQMERGRELALDELKDKARALGANAVVGIDFDYEVLGNNNGMLMVSVSGTAVVIQ